MSVAVDQRREVARAPGTPASLARSYAISCGATAGRPLTWGGGIGAMSALIAALWPSIEGSVAQARRTSTRRR